MLPDLSLRIEMTGLLIYRDDKRLQFEIKGLLNSYLVIKRKIDILPI